MIPLSFRLLLKNLIHENKLSYFKSQNKCIISLLHNLPWETTLISKTRSRAFNKKLKTSRPITVSLKESPCLILKMIRKTNLNSSTWNSPKKFIPEKYTLKIKTVAKLVRSREKNQNTTQELNKKPDKNQDQTIKIKIQLYQQSETT